MFKKPYEDWNTSEFATIKNIESSNYSFKKVNIVDIINNIQDSNIEKYYNKLKKM